MELHAFANLATIPKGPCTQIVYTLALKKSLFKNWTLRVLQTIADYVTTNLTPNDYNNK